MKNLTLSYGNADETIRAAVWIVGGLSCEYLGPAQAGDGCAGTIRQKRVQHVCFV